MTPRLTLTGAPGVYGVESAQVLGGATNWLPLTNVTLANTPVVFYDPTVGDLDRRFYRTLCLSCANVASNLVWINPGTFIMGSPADEVDGNYEEGPQRRVTLTLGYWMGKYEVTQGEYLAVMGTNSSYFNGDHTAGGGQNYGLDLNRPVERVTWDDATNYCAKLTASERLAGRLPTGYAYRLPTEAEWEYAARAGTTTRFSYGDDPGYTNLTDYAWFRGNSGMRTHPVGQKLPNPWGLYDTYGSVWEWCLDWDARYVGASSIDPKGPLSGLKKVQRGGSWSFEELWCRSASRGRNFPGDPYAYNGFRVVLAPGQPAAERSSRLASLTQLAIRMTPRLTVTGIPGVHAVEWAQVLGGATNWLPLTNVTLARVPVDFYDTAAGTLERRSYRTLCLSCAKVASNLVWINPGTFLMGSPANEVDRESDEGPQTQVTLTRGFFIDRYEVTQVEYQAVMVSNPSWYRADANGPVENVSWYDATNYCAKLTETERLAGRLPDGWVYRLPTEAEWEYAARAGTTTRFSYGDDSGYTGLANYGWYWLDNNSTTHVVGQKGANLWGLYDMCGNVWEWCWDWFGPYSGGSVIDPPGAATGSLRVLRGGSWVLDGRYCRSASRGRSEPSWRNGAWGFRVVLAPAQP